MKKLLICVAATAFLSSCAVINTPAGLGLIYTEVQSGQAVSGNSLGSKVGISKAQNILGLVAVGDASIQAAAKAAGITKISHVDQKQFSVLGVYGATETIVYGE